MTPDVMAERPIEDLAPDWIGLTVEVEDEHGVTVGFRLGRYEKSTVDGRPVWRLFSDQPSWSVTVYGGTKVRWIPASAPVSQTVPYPHQQPVPAAHPAPRAPQYPAAPPSAPAARSAQSWVTPPRP